MVYSNTTLVKVKYAPNRSKCDWLKLIQIQHLLKLNYLININGGSSDNSNTTLVKVKFL